MIRSLFGWRRLFMLNNASGCNQRKKQTKHPRTAIMVNNPGARQQQDC